MLPSLRILALVSITPIVFLLILFQASGFEAFLVPNSSVEAGSQNVTFNLTINNTNLTLNMTSLNVTLPPGFTLVQGSNQTSAQAAVFHNTSSLNWTNATPDGFIANLSEAWFSFNCSVNFTPGDYNFTISVTFTDSTSNSSVRTVTLNDTAPPDKIAMLSPTPGNDSWSNSSWFIVNTSFEELNPHTCLLDLGNGSSQNLTMARNGQACMLNASGQPQGTLNWSVWINDTSGNLAWNGTWFLNIGPVPHDLEPSPLSIPNGSWTNTSWFLANLTFTEDYPHTCLLELDNGTSHILNMTLNASQGFCWANVTGQQEGSLNYTLWMNNTAGAWNRSSAFHLTVDLTPPGITNRTVSVTLDSANVTWETASPADSLIEYGSGDAGNLTLNASSPGLVTYHNLTLGNLTMGTEYFYNLTSCDDLSVCMTSGPWNLTTLCLEVWSYAEWGECSDGQQSRSATDLNSCGTYDNRSAITRGCDSGGGGGGGGGGVASGEVTPIITKAWRSIGPGEPARMHITVAGIPATFLSVEVSDRVMSPSVKVEGLTSGPFQAPAPPGLAYSYMNVTSGINGSLITGVVMEFSVSRSWADSNTINISTIALLRLEKGGWARLDTRPFEDDEESLGFTSESPGLSWFAVTGLPLGNATGEESAQEPGEGPSSMPTSGETGQGPSSPGEGTLCSPGQRQCLAGAFVQECNQDGSGWVNLQTCPYGCRDGYCSRTISIEVDVDSLWMAAAAAGIIIALAIIYIKRKAIDDFLFWRL